MLRGTILFLLLGVLASPASARNAQLYLSWHAPWGYPGATDTVWVACGDTTRSDTLYLSFDPGRDDSTLFGMEATLYFRAQGSDTLGPNWKKPRGETFFPDIEISCGPDASFGALTPWSSSGLCVFHWDFERTSGRLRVMQGVAPYKAAPVRDGTIYTFARLILRRPAARMALCNQPICVEWWLGSLTWELFKEEPQVNKGGSRFVTMNMPRGKGCAEFSAADPSLKPWKPK